MSGTRGYFLVNSKKISVVKLPVKISVLKFEITRLTWKPKPGKNSVDFTTLTGRNTSTVNRDATRATVDYTY